MQGNKNIRIVSLAPSVTSILLGLGAGRELVGVSRWCKDVADVGNLPTVGDCWRLDTAEVMKLKPTIVVGSVPFAPETVAKILEQPVAFLAINPRTLADIESDIRTLGRLVNRPARAEGLIAKMQKAFSLAQRAADTIPASRRPRVYCEAWSNPRISSPLWVEEMVETAGGISVIPAGQRVTDEQIADANPDVIVLAWAATGDKAKPATALKNPAWVDVSAIRNKRAFVIRDELLNTPGPPLATGVQELQKIFRRFAAENVPTSKKSSAGRSRVPG
jgi:iron complex transport system substrate-binding protein